MPPLIDAEETDANPLPHQLPNAGRYSLGRALRFLSDPHNYRQALPGLEGEVSRELEIRGETNVRAGEGEHGLLIPYDALVRVPRERRDVTTTTATGAIPAVVGRPVIDVLRAKLVTGRLGATMLPDLRGGGSFVLPRRTATASLTYVAEGAAPTSSSMTATTVATISPTTVGVTSDATRRFWQQVPDAESIVTDDLFAAIAHEIDRAALAGTGSGGQPTGLFNLITPTYGGTNGLAPTYKLLCDLEAAIGNANAEGAAIGFLTSPNGRSVLRRTELSSGSGRVCWTPKNQVLGMPAEASTSAPSNLTRGSGSNLSGGLMGDWSSLIIGMWGAVHVLVNPFTQSTAGVVRITAMADYGVACRHVESFALLADMITS